MPQPTPASPDQHRRGGRRRPPKDGVHVMCRLGALAEGPDVALSVLDVSETGARLLVRRRLEPGENVVLGLGRPAAGRPAPRPGSVVWCQPATDGAYCVGVLFHRRLPIKDFVQLTLEYGASAGARALRPSAEEEAERSPDGHGANKRRSKRRATHPARRCRVSPPGGRLDLDSILLDLSETGVGLLTSGSLGANETIIVRVAGGPAGVPPLDLSARVLYAVELNSGWFLAGAEFAGPCPGDQLAPIIARIGCLGPGELLELTLAPQSDV